MVTKSLFRPSLAHIEIPQRGIDTHEEMSSSVRECLKMTLKNALKMLFCFVAVIKTDLLCVTCSSREVTEDSPQ